jgi:hypothetical protein
MRKLFYPIFYSIQDLEWAYTRNSMGHWFSRDTMRFFDTRLTSHFRNLGRNTYAFITTEKNPSGVRRASIRIAKVRRKAKVFCGYTIDIRTYGDFNSMTTARAARDLDKLKLKDLK